MSAMRPGSRVRWLPCPSVRRFGRSRLVFLGIALSVLVEWLLPSPALAHGPSAQQGWYLMLGGPVAVSTQPGFVMGGEASLVCLECVGDRFSLIWVGGYLDGVHDFGADTTRFSIGPEFGVLVFGADTGPLLSVGHGETAIGWQGRALVTLARFGLYGRSVYVKDQGWLGEFGALWKIDLFLGSP